MEARAGLERAELFAGLTSGELDQLFALARRQSFASGSTIFQESSKEYDLFLLLSGIVDIRVNVPLENRTESLALIRASEIFGEFSLIDHSPRSASALAVGPVEVLSISRADFEALCEKNHRIGYVLMRNLAGLLCRKIRQTNMQWRNVIMYY